MTEMEAALLPKRRVRSLLGNVILAGLALWTAILSVNAARAAEPATHLTISFSERVGDQLPLWIAQDAGYFRKEGLAVTLRYLPAREGIPALLTDQVQIASIGGPDGLSAEAAGTELKYFATLSPVLTFQLWAQPKYAKPSALKGQRIGVSSTTGSLYTATILALQKLGLAANDVAITPLGNVPNVDGALLAGSIAAATSHPPATYEFQKHGFVKLVDLASERISAINTGLAATSSYVQTHGEIVQKVVDGLIEGLRREKSDRAFTEKVMDKYMHVKTKAVADFTYDFYAKEVAPAVPMPEVSQLVAAQKALSATNPKMKNVELAAMIDQQFVKAAIATLHAK